MIPMEENLLDLYARLSRSSERNRLHSMRAKKDGRNELAHLFLALAESKAMQARRFLMQIRGTIETTEENEYQAFAIELPAAIEVYRLLTAVAEEEGSKALVTGFSQSAEVDRRIVELHDTLEERGENIDYYVCDFCGYVAVDEPPDNCPVCTAPKKRFKKVDAG